MLSKSASILGEGGLWEGGFLEINGPKADFLISVQSLKR